MKTKKIRILIVDDHPLFREGLNNIVSLNRHIEIVAEASDGLQAIELCRRHNPDVVLMDIHMPRMDGVEATAILHKEFPSIEVLALSMANDEDFLYSMTDAGAIGYLSKSADKHEVRDAIEMAAQHKEYFSNDITMQLAYKMATRNNPSSAQSPPSFSDTEKQIIELVMKENTTQEISDIMGYKFRSIEKYRTNIIQKMGVRNMVGIAMYAVRNKIVKL